jgi:hypothetical protein
MWAPPRAEQGKEYQWPTCCHPSIAKSVFVVTGNLISFRKSTANSHLFPALTVGHKNSKQIAMGKKSTVKRIFPVEQDVERLNKLIMIPNE